MMLLSKYLSLAVFFIISFAFQRQVLAVKKSYIVYLGAHSHGPEITSDDLDRVTDSHHEFLGSFLGRKEVARDAIFYSYQRHINGFAAILEEEVAAEIARHPDVVSVFLNRENRLHTTHSWNFLNLEDSNGEVRPHSLWKKANFGQDIIIANIDTGVWPESRSFSDEGFGPVPCRWNGSCESQNGSFPCNRKLIGAKYFNKGYIANGGKVKAWMNDARDYNGHGTHTLSTAGGNFVPGANLFGIGNGTAKGGSPKARLAAYKVCWPSWPFDFVVKCTDADILQAFDMAIHDGVDVISISLGSNRDYLHNSVAIGAFHALTKNIIVVGSAGNSGPKPGTVSNTAPWIITVGASTSGRDFLSGVELVNGLHFQGAGGFSESLPKREFYPLIDAAKANAANSSAGDSMLCKRGTLDRQKVEGKILVCLKADSQILELSKYAAHAGATGIIVRNQESSGDEIYRLDGDDFYMVPAVHIGYEDGLSLVSYMNSTNDPMGYILPPTTLLHEKTSPSLAFFSSRGPSMHSPEILKPDITAPGVNVIAADSEAATITSLPYDKRHASFMFMTGTSMSCPHVAGIVGLLKTLHPDWSPAAIRSAIMTTARKSDSILNLTMVVEHHKATPFGYGAGHVQPNRAMDPGLVYDLTVKDHLDFLCAVGYNQTAIRLFSSGTYECPKDYSFNSFNYPSITVPNLKCHSAGTVTRTLKNVGAPGNYTAHIRQPAGVSVFVEPSILKFEKIGEEKSFKLTLQAKNRTHLKSYVFGELLWSDGHHHVRSPIVIASAAKKKKEHPKMQR